MSSHKSQDFSELDSVGMCSTNNPRNFSDDMIQVISSDGKSNRSHSHGPKCRHHHHNHSHINEKDDIKSQSEDIFRHLKSFWIVIPFTCLFLFKEAAIHSIGMYFSSLIHLLHLGLWVLISLCVTSFYLNSRLKGATQGVSGHISNRKSSSLNLLFTPF